MYYFYYFWYDGFLVSNVIDRNILICIRMSEIGKVCFLKIIWWKVDLGKVKSIYSV